MSRRGPRRGRDLPDYHLWVEVKRSVTPLRPDPDEEKAPPPPLPLPPEKAAPTRVALNRELVIGARPAPASPPSQRPTPAGRVIEPGVKRRVRSGRIDIDGRIDLHGMRQAEAREALGRFIRAHHLTGDRTLLVITGKGISRSEDGAPERGVLRTMLPIWLGEPDLAPLVAGFDHAARGHGGDGAFYVRLRRGAA